ncbi:hypothetical protein Y590_17100 [Methylobacterium sp. AMS5]|nr:hypothetical protein Y590_17100 [Methylobacterium sp. AMS5]
MRRRWTTNGFNSTAVFDFQLTDLGIQGPTDADKARPNPLSDQLRSLWKESACY